MGAGGITNFTSIVEAKSLGSADIDKITAAIDKQNAALDKLATKATNVNKNASFEQFAEKVRQGIQNPLQTLGDVAADALKSLGPMGAAVAATGAALGAVAAFGLQAAKGLGEYADRIDDIAVRTGLTRKEVSEFSFAMQRAGGDIASVEGLMKKLSQGLADGSAEGKGARDALRELGIQTRDASGSMLPMSGILLQISESLAAIPDTANRNATAIKILGKSALEALPDLLELAEGVKRARELGIGPSNAEIDRWNSYQKQIVELDAAWEKLKRDMKDPIAATVLFTIKAAQETTAVTQGLTDFWAQMLFGGRQTGKDQEFGETEGLGFGASESRSFRTRQRAAAGSLGSFLKGGLEGATAELDRLKGKYEEARNKAQALSDAGVALPDVAIKARTEVEKTHSAYKAQVDVVKQLAKDEERRLAALEKARDLIAQGAGRNLEGFLQFPNGVGTTFITGQQIAAANQRPRNPSLFGRGQVNPFSVVDAIKVQQEMQADLKGGLQQTGEFVSPQSDREATSRAAAGLSGSRIASELDRIARDRQAVLANQQAIADASARLIELRAGPGGELQAARETATLRQQALEREFQVTGDIAKYRVDSKRNELDLTLRIAELERQRLDNIRNEAGRLFDALLQGPKGLQQFARDFLLGEARKVFQNIAVEVFKGASTHLGLPGKIFQGTIFGQDPLKGATDLLKTSTDTNTTATDANSQAIRELTAAIQAARAGAVSPSGGGGSFSPSFSTFSGLVQRGLAEEIGYGASQAAGYSRNAAGLVVRGADASLENLPLSHRSGTDPLLLYPEPAGAKSSSSRASGAGIYKGVGYAAAGLAAYSGARTVAHGGAQNVLGGSGELAGAAAGILMLAGVSGPAAPILAGVGLGLGLVSSLFGDPKQRRQKEIDSWLQSHQYQGPDPVSITRDLYGRDISYDMRGNLRPITINQDFSSHVGQAFDGQDVERVLVKNAAALNRAVSKAVDEGGDMVPKLSQALSLS